MSGKYAVMPLEDYEAACDAFQEKTGSNINQVKSGELPTKINEVFEAGKQAEYDEFWGKLQNYGNKAQYNGAFQANIWTDTTYTPKYPIVASYGNSMFSYNARITDTKVPIDISEATQALYVFQGSTTMVTIRSLKVNASQTYTKFFQDCSKLKNITFAEGSEIGRTISFADSPLLTVESMLSVINHLVNYAGTSNANKYSVTFHANAWSRLQTWWQTENEGNVKDYIASLGWKTA